MGSFHRSYFTPWLFCISRQFVHLISWLLCSYSKAKNLNGPKIQHDLYIFLCHSLIRLMLLLEILSMPCPVRYVTSGCVLSGLYYLYGAPVLPLWLWGPSWVLAVSSAQHRGQTHKMWSHFPHALHAGHVQQWNQGVHFLTNTSDWHGSGS